MLFSCSHDHIVIRDIFSLKLIFKFIVDKLCYNSESANYHTFLTIDTNLAIKNVFFPLLSVAVDFVCDHPDIRAISFVGSDHVGKYIYERGSANGKRVQSNMVGTVYLHYTCMYHHI